MRLAWVVQWRVGILLPLPSCHAYLPRGEVVRSGTLDTEKRAQILYWVPPSCPSPLWPVGQEGTCALHTLVAAGIGQEHGGREWNGQLWAWPWF